MNEENKFGPKKRWTRIFRKRWFFPSLYLVLAALLISAVVWYTNNGDEQVVDESLEQTDDYTPIPSDDSAVPVMDQQEVIQLPVANAEEAQIVTKFFDYNADEADQVNALIHYNNRYYQSTGIDITSADGESFEVVAALSGTVSEVKEDPLLGNVVVIAHDNDVKTYYASLSEVSVEANDRVEQGDAIGTAGKNNFGKDNGNHVHFEIRKANEAVNPEAVVNQPLASVDSLVSGSEEEAETSAEEDAEPTAEEADEVDESAEEDSDEGEDSDAEGEEAESEDAESEEESSDEENLEE